jgi:hypothetical protein
LYSCFIKYSGELLAILNLIMSLECQTAITKPSTANEQQTPLLFYCLFVQKQGCENLNRGFDDRPEQRTAYSAVPSAVA